MTAKLPEATFILISSHEMEDAWRDLFLASLATVISWFETNLSIVSDGFCCIGGGDTVATGLLSACALPGKGDLVAAEFTLAAAEVAQSATGRHSVPRSRADDGRRERHFCPLYIPVGGINLVHT